MAKDRLIVKNFGPIKEVDINLAKVTVFIGEQASGKSVLAKLVTFLSNPVASESRGNRDLPINSLVDFNINTFLNNNSYASIETDKFIFGFKEWGADSFKTFKDENLDALYSKVNELLEENEHDTVDVLMGKPFNIDIMDQYFKKQDIVLGKLNTIIEVIKEFFPESIYIPTERNLISILSKSLFNLLKNDVELPAFVKTFGSTFETSRKIVRGTDIPALKLKYAFAENTDKIILENNEQIDLLESSSGVQSIVPLAVVVNAVPKTGKHLFIVEEPELNLYPTTQKALVEYLVEKCTHGDNRLIITTHSPYILTALNNCIQAKNVVNMHPESAEEVEKLVPSKYHLDYQDVAAYYVSDGRATSILNEESQMIDANAIDDVSEQLGSIFDQLLDLKYQNQD